MFRLLMVVSSVILIALDQVTKWLANTYLKGNDPFVLIKGVFELKYTENPGAAFGIFPGSRVILIGVTSIALIALFIALITGTLGRSKLVEISGTLVISGGVGNLIDRIFRHKVIDFFYFKIIEFPIFNVADCFVVVGSCMILLYFLFIYKDSKQEAKLEPKGEDTSDEIANPNSNAGNDGREN